LSGSQNAKIQKLRLHRLSGFGMLEGSKQADVIELLELLLANGLLRQQEVNRNRPTVAVAPELADAKQRQALIAGIQIPQPLLAKFIAKILKCATPAAPPLTSPSALQAASTGAALLPAAEIPQAAKTSGGASAPWQAASTPMPVESLGEARTKPVLQVRPTEETGSQPTTMAESESAAVREIEDWTWSIKLLRSGLDWNAVTAIRRMTDIELAGSLIAALQQGEQIERGWLASPDASGERTVGQQRVQRELQRRSAAGVR
jgi:hypothetical protein